MALGSWLTSEKRSALTSALQNTIRVDNPPAQSDNFLGKPINEVMTEAFRLRNTPVSTPNVAGGTKTYYDPTNYSTRGVAVNAWGINKKGEVVKPDIGAEQQYYNELLKKSEQQAKISAISGIGQSLVGMANAHQYYKDIKKTKQQYENQKSLIDTNVMKAETAIQDTLTENMAKVDAMAAAQNVDVSSGAIRGIKQQGGIDAGNDIRDMQEQANLNKLALDLDYAMKVKSAKRAESDAIAGGLFNIGMGIAQYSMGV